MKIMHIIHSLSGGGAERQLLSLVNTAKSNGIEMAIFCVRPENSYMSPQTIYVAKSKRSWTIGFFIELLSAINSFKPDVIHVWLPPAVTIPAMLAARLKCLPIVFSYRNAMHFRRKIDVVEYFLALVFSQRVISNTSIETCAPLYQFLYRQKKGAYIANSVQVNQRKQDITLKNSPRQLIFVGRITASKNWITLLNAIAQLKERHDWQLSIYGVGEDEAALHQKIEELELDGFVSHFGFSSSIYNVMSQADALIFPSLYEGMPNVLLEALAIGLYVVASDIPANRKVIGDVDCVDWFSPLDSQKLSECIEDFLENRVNVKKCISNGIEIAKNYSPDNTFQLHMATYKNVLG